MKLNNVHTKTQLQIQTINFSSSIYLFVPNSTSDNSYKDYLLLKS